MVSDAEWMTLEECRRKAVQAERERIASWHERKHREYYSKAADQEKYPLETRYKFTACSAWHLESALAIRDGTYAEDMAR